MVVGSGWVEIWIPEVHSLKEKRGILSRLIKRTQHEFNISIAEVGLNDTWKRACIGFSIVGNDRIVVEKKMALVVRFIEDLNLGEVVDIHQEYMNVSRTAGELPSTYGEDKYGDL
jgi:uncharacterized protein YlxP (DUF503 family)